MSLPLIILLLMYGIWIAALVVMLFYTIRVERRCVEYAKQITETHNNIKKYWESGSVIDADVPAARSKVDT